ncbi:MAG: hypothetical protein LBL07_17715 [Tannerella sp.]|jgi:hypothetical protein|nr:hypothetical protein [Tannerella sp.]
MIRNTDKRRAGDVPAGADSMAETAAGTFGNCRRDRSSLSLTWHSLHARQWIKITNLSKKQSAK